MTEETGLMSVPESVMLTQNWVTVLSVTGILILVGYLLNRLYVRRIFSNIKLCAVVSSTSKAVTIMVMKLPGSPTNYHLQTIGPPKVTKVVGLPVKPVVEMEWSGLELIDRLSGMKCFPPTMC